MRCGRKKGYLGRLDFLLNKKLLLSDICDQGYIFVYKL